MQRYRGEVNGFNTCYCLHVGPDTHSVPRFVVRRTHTVEVNTWNAVQANIAPVAVSYRCPSSLVLAMTVPLARQFRFPHRQMAGVALAAFMVSPMLAGCRRDQPLEPQPVPRADDTISPRVRHDTPRPLPPDAGADDLSYMEDAPLLNVPPPEAGPFVEAYNAVGRPKIVVFVNRTLEGAVIPTTEERILDGRRRVVETTGAADVERTERSGSYSERDGYYGGQYGERSREQRESLTTSGPARIEERTETYLPPGEYDEIWAKRVDYEALENALADAMHVRGEVAVLSPRLVRQRLTADEVRALEEGRPAVLEGLAERLGADVLVHVQARPTAQTVNGLDLRIVAEALNTRGGESIGRANADFPGPMSAARLNDVSRYMARRLMDGMTGSWTAAPQQADQAQQDPPAGEQTPATQPRQ